MTEEFTAHGIYLMAVEEFGPIVEEGEVIRNAAERMKLLPILLLTLVLSLGVGCSSEPAVPPTATPDVPKYSEGEAIGIVQGMLRTHGNKDCWNLLNGRYQFKAGYHKGKWSVLAEDEKGRYTGAWVVYEGSNAVETAVSCRR